MKSILYDRSFRINDDIQIRIPTVGEVFDHEEEYYEAVCSVISTPTDLMVQLEDAGIDFTKINDFELFCLTFPKLQEMDTTLLFGDLDFKGYRVAINKATGEPVLRNPETGSNIDVLIHHQMASFFRKILFLEKNELRPANEEAKKYLLYRARKKLKRAARRRVQKSVLEEYIVALVNCEKFKYDFTTVRDLTIYQFYLSLQEVAHRIRFDNTMIGCYAGTIKSDDLSKEDRTWIMKI